MKYLVLCVLGVLGAMAVALSGCGPQDSCDTESSTITRGGETPIGGSVSEIIAPYEGQYVALASSIDSDEVYELTVQLEPVGEAFEYNYLSLPNGRGECGDNMSGGMQFRVVGEDGQVAEDVRGRFRVDFSAEGEVIQRNAYADISTESMRGRLGLSGRGYEAVRISMQIADGRVTGGYINGEYNEGLGRVLEDPLFTLSSPDEGEPSNL